MVLFLPEINFMLLKERFKGGQNCTEDQPLGTPEGLISRTRLKKKVVLPVCALEKVCELTKKFLQRSHLVLLQLKHPADSNVIDSGQPFLHLEGARISLTFLDLRKDEIMEFESKK